MYHPRIAVSAVDYFTMKQTTSNKQKVTSDKTIAFSMHTTSLQATSNKDDPDV